MLVLLVALGIILTVSFKTTSRSVVETPVPQQTLPHNVDIALHNARFTEMRDATVVWELVASRATYSKSGDVATLHDITMTFAATKNAGKCIVTAQEGTYFDKTRNVSLRGNVHIETENGARFDTDALEYDSKRSLFSSKSVITFNHDRLSLKASEMELDVVHQKARFYKETDAIVSGRLN